MRVRAFTRYGARAASTRQRLLQYLPSLAEAGIEVEWHALLDDDYVQSLATGEPYSRTRVVAAYAKRFLQLLERGQVDLIWIYVELFPYLPAWMEQAVVEAGVPLVYDLDDAFFHQYDGHASPLVRSMLGDKFGRLLGRAAACACGNSYLRDFAGQYCANSIALPTVVDTAAYRPVEGEPARKPLTIGWIGSPSTWINVRPLLPLITKMCASRDARFRVVGAGKDAEADRFPGLDLVEWSEPAEVAEIQAMDIGIMPLLNRPFQRGKSGYKLVQYMACGLPVVASPVGVNSEIVNEGENGFLATSEKEWNEALTRLIDDPELRAGMGRKGRAKVEASYSLATHASRFAELLKGAVERKPD